jgi:hypothetical protein
MNLFFDLAYNNTVTTTTITTTITTSITTTTTTSRTNQMNPSLGTKGTDKEKAMVASFVARCKDLGLPR